MSVILVLVPLSLLLAGGFLAGFIWAVRSGQYEDTCTPALRLLLEEPGKGMDGARIDGARIDGARIDGARIDGARIDGAGSPSEKHETDQR